MKKTHITFPSIGVYRNVIKTVRERASYDNLPLPKITFTGTVKVHGTNAAVCSIFDGSDFWVQSRSNIITPQSDNAGFAQYVETQRLFFENLINNVKMYFNIVQETTINDGDSICVYGEWCGGSIQKGVALNSLPKMFVIFAIATFNGEEYTWLPSDAVKQIFVNHMVQLPYSPIKCILSFPSWSITIDFANPEAAQNQLCQITEDVERCCPVAFAISNVQGIGEGVVWRAEQCDSPYFNIDELTFKVKGEKHSVTKVKTLASVDIEKVNSISEYVNNVLTEARLQQGISFLIETGLPVDNVSTGPFLKWIGNDVLKEESDTLDGSGLARKDVMPVLNRKARNWFLKQIV